MWSEYPKRKRSTKLIIGVLVCFSCFCSAYIVPTPFGRRRFRLPSLSSTKEPSEDGIGVGIDLGTTFSAVAVIEDGIPTIIPVPNNGRTMPSVVNVNKNGAVLVGKEAIEKEVSQPLGTYRNVKRVIGVGCLSVCDIADVVPNLSIRQEGGARRKKGKKGRKKEKGLSLEKKFIDATQNPALLFLPPSAQGVREKVMPEVISSHVLRKLYDTAEAHTGKKVDRAVIGVPAYFDESQCEATIRASKLAGVSKARLLIEPEAAALAYGIGRDQVGQGDSDELVMVFDLGGGTYDVSMLLVGGGLTQVISSSGDAMLGGSDFDLAIAEYMATAMFQNGAERNILKGGGGAADSMVRAAEAIRIFLSNNRAAFLTLPLTASGWSCLEHPSDVIVDYSHPQDPTANETHLMMEINRKTMEGICDDMFQKLMRPIREVAIMAGALLPGDARPSIVHNAMEMEKEYVKANKKKGVAFEDFYPDESVMKDPAADIDPKLLLELKAFDLKEQKKEQQNGRKKARLLSKQDKKFRQEKRKVNVAGNKRVIEGIEGRPISQVVLVGGATRMPAIGRMLGVVTGVTPRKTVNPDEAVALGCAVQVGILDGDESLGTVLNPLQSALLEYLAQTEGMMANGGGSKVQEIDESDEDFESINYEEAYVQKIELHN